MLVNFKWIRFRWIPREENTEADSLRKKAYHEYVEKNPDIIERYKRYMITDKQKRYIMFLCRKLSRSIPENLDLMSKREASKFDRYASQ